MIHMTDTHQESMARRRRCLAVLGSADLIFGTSHMIIGGFLDVRALHCT